MDMDVENLLNEIETRKFLYDEDFATQNDPEQLSEDAEKIRVLEVRLQALLGNNGTTTTPEASIERNGQPGPSNPPASVPSPTGRSTISSQTASTASPNNNSPVRTPAGNGEGPSNRQIGARSGPHQPWRANLITPSRNVGSPETILSSPSSFASPSNRGPEVLYPSISDVSRKRPRHNSTTSPTSAPSKRQALINKYEIRMERLSEALDAKLTEIHRDYERRKNDAEDLQVRALIGGLTVPAVLEALQEEMEEEERVARRDINLQRDEAMARKLHAENLVENDREEYPARPPIINPYTTLGGLPAQPTDPYRFDQSGFRAASSIPAAPPYDYHSHVPHYQQGLQQYIPLGNDDLEEISGESFHSKFGPPVGRTPAMHYPPGYPPGFSSARHFGWPPDPAGLAMKAIDEQNLNTEDDEIESVLLLFPPRLLK